VRGFFRRDALAGEIREELEFHVRMRADEYERAGESAESAARHARQRVGNLAVLQDQGYAIRGGGLVDTIAQDVRYARRLLWQHRTFSSVAVLTLATGIGLSTAVASISDAALLHPLPYPRPDDLVQVSIQARRPQFENLVLKFGPSPEEVATWRGTVRTVVAFGTSSPPRTSPITDTAIPERLRGMDVSVGYFDVYGVSSALGRLIQPADTQENAPLVTLIGFDFWQNRLGGRRDVIGQPLRLDDGSYTIIGVLPRAFQRNVAVWRPLRVPAGLASRQIGSTVARLRHGATIEAAEQELTVMLAHVPDAHPDARVVLTSLRDTTAQRYQTTVYIFASAIALILLIACVNVAGLLLARGRTRLPELAVRVSLGAGRWRLVRQLLTESVLLAAIGGVIGVLVAWWSLGAIVANLPLALPVDAPATLNWRVLLFSAGLALATGLLFGLYPALSLSRASTPGHLAVAARRSGSPLSRRGGQGLIATEAALALVLLAGAGLMVRSFAKVLSVDLGFRPEAIVSLQATPVNATAATFATYYPALVQAVRSLPGVAAVGAIDHLPLDGTAVTMSAATAAGSTGVNINYVLPGYFDAMDLKVRQGRVPDEDDLASGRPVAVVNESAAKAMFPDRPAVGQTLVVPRLITAEVIGVVSDVRFDPIPRGLPASDVFFLYRPVPGRRLTALTVVLRPGPGASVSADRLRQVAESLGPRVLVEGVRRGTDWLDDRVTTPRQRTVLLGLLGALALMLALVGVFGMTAYAVAQRSHEIGVRMVCGARPVDAVRTMLRDAIPPLGLGVTLGLGIAAFATRIIATFLFQTTPTDPATFAGVAALLVVAAGVAAWIPARRAARVDPVVVLRES
jgi:putative ABC transport system permease protein